MLKSTSITKMQPGGALRWVLKVKEGRCALARVNQHKTILWAAVCGYPRGVEFWVFFLFLNMVFQVSICGVDSFFFW